MSIISKMFGSYSEREVKRIKPLLNQINGLRESMAALSDEQLREKTNEYN